MNMLTMILGGALVVFSLVSLCCRIWRPQVFHKLEPMKRFWGPRLGSAIHLAGYVLLPLGYGVYLLIRGIDGYALF